MEHHRDTQRPLQGELDHDGQRGDHQVPERDGPVNQGRDAGERRQGAQLQQGADCVIMFPVRKPLHYLELIILLLVTCS